MESSNSSSMLPQPTQVRVRLIIINFIFKRRCGKAGMHDKGPVSFPLATTFVTCGRGL